MENTEVKKVKGKPGPKPKAAKAPKPAKQAAPKPVLTAADEAAIRAMQQAGAKKKEICDRFGITNYLLGKLLKVGQPAQAQADPAAEPKPVEPAL